MTANDLVEWPGKTRTAPLAPLFNSLTRPFLRPFQRLIPPIGNEDLSPLFILVLAQLALILITHGYRVVAGMF